MRGSVIPADFEDVTVRAIRPQLMSGEGSRYEIGSQITPSAQTWSYSAEYTQALALMTSMWSRTSARRTFTSRQSQSAIVAAQGGL